MTTPKAEEKEGNVTQIIPKEIEDEMRIAYVNYAMSVIVGRALPDVRDGLKPVHRRILYAMSELGMYHNKPFKKSARIVGEVLGKFHPHGDTAVYDALVRMAQDFSLRYPLVKGQGNFGSIDGDNPAAMRYTEAKLHRLAEEMLKDIEKDTVDFKNNFDGSLKEPEVLPSKLPNLLVNGSSGIAVGMATSIPPHNVNEICEGVIALIDKPEISVEELMKIIPAPDFPTGGEVACGAALWHAYARGKGKVTIKAVAGFEKDKIVITEIPYMVNKAEMIEQIADLVNVKKIQGIRNINDESDREGIRIVIDLKKDVDAQVVLNQLYQFSRLKISFGINLLSLVEGQPKVMGLKELLSHHIRHRREVITRRTRYDLDQAEKKLHVIEGLLVALGNVDNVVNGIKNSRTVDDAKEFLMITYSLTEIQAKAILEMRLQKLASLEQEKLKDEHGELVKMIKLYKEILGSGQMVLNFIKEEMEEIKSNYGDKRRSRIIESEEDYFDVEELIEEETVVVTMSKSGYVKRLPLDTYKTQKRGGKGVKAAGMKEEDYVESVYVTSTHAYLLFFTDMGQMYWLKVWQLPVGSRQAKGKHIANILEIKGDEAISAIIPVYDFKEGYLFMATKQGIVKKTELLDFSRPRKGGIRAISLDENDSLVGVKLTIGDKEIILATRKGLANRFMEMDIRPVGRTARGVRGIRLRKDDEVIGMLAAEEGKDILTITEKGYGKRTPVSEYRLCNRGGKGVTNVKITEKNGPVKAVMLVDGTEDIMLVSKNGIGIRVRCSDISSVGRAAQGVRIMRLSESDLVAAAARIVVEDDNGNGGSSTNGNNMDKNNINRNSIDENSIDRNSEDRPEKDFHNSSDVDIPENEGQKDNKAHNFKDIKKDNVNINFDSNDVDSDGDSSTGNTNDTNDVGSDGDSSTGNTNDNGNKEDSDEEDENILRRISSNGEPKDNPSE